MNGDNVREIPPVIGIPPLLPARKPRAPTLYAIVVFKFLKGLLLLLAAVIFLNLRDGGLQEEFTRALRDAHLEGQMQLVSDFLQWLQSVSPGKMRATAVGTVLYGIFSFIEGTGLFFRAKWGAWAAILESSVFIPIEVVELVRSFSVLITVVLVLNVAIVWYLYANRQRLFTHG